MPITSVGVMGKEMAFQFQDFANHFKPQSNHLTAETAQHCKPKLCRLWQ